MPNLRIVHEGRGGYIEIDGVRYAIEHVEGGRFSIHVLRNPRHAKQADHLAVLSELARGDPSRWQLEEATSMSGPGATGIEKSGGSTGAPPFRGGRRDKT